MKTTDSPGLPRAQQYWLIIIMSLICIIVFIGGITRLTQSGLSMVEWKPIMGSIPPLSESKWAETFELYKQFPEYQKINSQMTISQFKKIFFWEYLHRMLGRLIGLSIIIPYLIFLFRKKLSSYIKRQGALMIILVVLQGLMGWYMVKSGLTDNPHVSHYRLASHLGLAFFLLQVTCWTLYQGLSFELKPLKEVAIRHYFKVMIGLLSLQIAYGAFTAGLKAGYGFNTFPKMGDKWIPSGLFFQEPWVRNLVENWMTVQFIHRYLGVLLVVGIVVLYCLLRTRIQTRMQFVSNSLIANLVVIQFGLGVLTLVHKVQISLAVFHQVVGMLLLTVMILGYYSWCIKERPNTQPNK